MRRLLPLLVLLSLPALAAAQPAKPHAKVGEEILAHVREKFLDAEKGRAWAERHAGYGARARDAEDFTRLTREALAELGTSHTAYYPRDAWENLHLRSLFGAFVFKGPPVTWVSLGLDVAELPEGHFVRHVFVGGPGAKAGLLRGDRLLAVDGTPFHPVRALTGKAGRAVRLTVERTRGAPPLTLTATPRKVAPKAEWREHQEASSTVVERGGKRVAYQHVYSCAGAEPLEVLKESLAGPLAEADALVLDFRDGWGGCPPEVMDLFNPLTPAMAFTDRNGKGRVWSAAWRKPVVLLVHDNSRSGKEMIAAAFRRHRVGTLVGQRTAGAVLAGRPLPLSDGGLLYLAVEEVRVDGERLEGAGVPVDVEVLAPLPYAEGKDAQRERALDVAAERAAAAR
jgi:carboxyl-terminal processing protease